ncbi:MAG: hypothetical protein MUD01_24195 [Chloroflexaceae bacterium]|jgi:hypothetical protein|nr:hypothetical protein [Chloroflexaceae bacterium]
MAWETYACINDTCKGRPWCVQRDEVIPDLWYVAPPAGWQSFTIAAAEPICPLCGSSLVAVLEFEEHAHVVKRKA